MLRAPTVISLCVVVLCAGAAQAADPPGTVTGTVVAPVPARGVVWLEGPALPRPSPPAAKATITPRGQRFDPSFSVIVAGQEVVFPQVDAIMHDVYGASRSTPFRLGSYPRGQSKSVRFAKPGIVELFCHQHEDTHGSLVVVPSALYAMLDASGRFTIGGVPPGRYLLRAYSPDGGSVLLRVEVKAGATSTPAVRFPRHDPPKDENQPKPQPYDGTGTPPQFRQPALPATRRSQ